MKKGQTRRPAVISAGDRKALTEFLTKGGQWLPPLVELLERSAAAIDDVIDVVGRAMIEAVLQLAAGNVAGPKVQGQLARRDVYWYGSQQGEVVLSDRRLKVTKPRLRRRGVGAGGEVEIPAYARLREGGLGEHVVQLMMQGVSTRNQEPVLREMADTAGVSKSQIGREWIEASSARLEELQARRFDHLDILVVWVDGMQFGDHHVLAAVGADRTGVKHVPGVAAGSSENYHVARDLLCGIIERGLDPGRLRLFIIDGSRALRKAISELFGSPNPVQRCRTHKLRNVTERLPVEKRADVKKVMRAACRLVRGRTRRVSRWRDAAMVLRWSATAFLECEKRFRRIMGHRDLWMLEQAPNALAQQHELATARKIA
jgi:transposase-like protein